MSNNIVINDCSNCGNSDTCLSFHDFLFCPSFWVIDLDIEIPLKGKSQYNVVGK